MFRANLRPCLFLLGSWVIVNEVYFIYRDSKLSARSLGFALGKYRKLLELADTLPRSMLRLEKTPHWVLILQ